MLYSHDSAEKVCAGNILMTGIRCAELVCCGTWISFGEKFTALFDLLMMGKKACVLMSSL